MTRRSSDAWRSVTGSSVVVGALLRAGSLAVAAVVGSIAWFRELDARIAIGLRRRSVPPERRDEDLRILTNDSLTLRALSRLVDAPAVAWDNSGIKRFVDGLLTLDLGIRMSLAGWVLLTAVLTHVLVLAVLGVPVQALGWTMRALLALVALVLLRRPEAFAAAWRARMSR